LVNNFEQSQKITIDSIRNYLFVKKNLKLAVYLYFSKKNYIILSGKSYGFDFLLYE